MNNTNNTLHKKTQTIHKLLYPSFVKKKKLITLSFGIYEEMEKRKSLLSVLVSSSSSLLKLSIYGFNWLLISIKKSNWLFLLDSLFSIIIFSLTKLKFKILFKRTKSISLYQQLVRLSNLSLILNFVQKQIKYERNGFFLIKWKKSIYIFFLSLYFLFNSTNEEKKTFRFPFFLLPNDLKSYITFCSLFIFYFLKALFTLFSFLHFLFPKSNTS